MSKLWFLIFSVSFSLAVGQAFFTSKSQALDLEEEFGAETLVKSYNAGDSPQTKEQNFRQPLSSKSSIRRDRSFKVPDSKLKTKKREKLNLKAAKPPSSIKAYYPPDSDEAELERIMEQEEEQLYSLLKKNRNDPELILRLGALYVDRSRSLSFKIQSDYDQKMIDFKSGRRSTKPYLNLKSAQVYNKKSLELIKNFQVNYPNHKRTDEVLFFLGFNFYQLDNKKQGIKYYEELERRFPKSFYLYDARFQLGEHYFQLRNWKQSLKYYSLVAKRKTGKFYFLALYKMAWSLYKMNRITQGLGLLERVIKEGSQAKMDLNRSSIFTYNSEAIQDLVLFYVYSKKTAGSAISFFNDLVGGEQAQRLLKKLAKAYRDTGQTRRLLVLSQALIKDNPSGKDAFDLKYQMVEAIYSTGNISDIINIMGEWVKEYGPGSPWFTANQDEGDIVEESLKLQELTVRDYALKSHQSFRKTKSKRSKNLALGLYKLYFKAFKNSEFSDEMHFWHAELLFDLKQYVSAVKAYESIISFFPKSKYVDVAYLNQILALEKVLPSSAQIKQMVQSSSDALEMPPAVKSFVKAGRRYLTRFPKSKNSVDILYNMAEKYYQFNHFDKAISLFKIFTQKYPSHKLINDVNLALLEMYSKTKDYDSLEALATELYKNKNLDKNLLREARSLLEQISFKKAQDLSVKENYEESSLLYEQFAKTYPTSHLAVTAFYNAGLGYEKIGDSLKAIAMYSKVLTYKDKGSLSLRKKSQEFSAILYEKLGFYKKAAESYSTFAKQYPSDPKSSDFWYNAGVIFDALNDVGSAVFSYNKYYQLSKKSDRYDTFYLKGLMYERNRNWKRAIENYDKLLKSSTSNALNVVKASFSIADIYQIKLKNPALAKTWHQKTLDIYRKLRKGSAFAARSHFYLVRESHYKPFSRIKIPNNPATQERFLAKKIESLQNLEKALKPVIRYDEGESILASLVLIGKANQELAREIQSTPLPKGLNSAGRAKYRQEILKVIDPYIKKSIKHYRLAIERSMKLKVYSESIREAYSGLAQVQLSKGDFVKFLPESLFQHSFSVVLTDSAGTVNVGFLKKLRGSLKYGLSLSDFKKLSQAIASNKESLVLSAVSSILNKDSKNLAAINTLAFFYLQKNRLGLAQLVLNRLHEGKEPSDPVVLNNLAVIALKYGKIRPALALFKKALSEDSSYRIAQINLANIFIRQWDYQNAYNYYKKVYDDIIENTMNIKKYDLKSILSNYSVALTGTQKWSEGDSIFKSLVESPSPRPEFLFNYASFLSERSKREPKKQAHETLNKAKDLADELKTYKLKSRLRLGRNKLSKNISELLKIRK